MARRGPKGIDPSEKKKRGTEQPCRKVEVLFSDHASRPDPEDIPPPPWLNETAKKIWREKINRYRQRNQKIGGFEDLLAHYCALEADLIDKYYKKDNVPPMAMVNAHRIYASEFYDTPASQKVPAAGGGTSANKFSKNGNRP